MNGTLEKEAAISRKVETEHCCQDQGNISGQDMAVEKTH